MYTHMYMHMHINTYAQTCVHKHTCMYTQLSIIKVKIRKESCPIPDREIGTEGVAS